MVPDSSYHSSTVEEIKSILPQTSVFLAQSAAEGIGGQLYVSLKGNTVIDFAWGKSHTGQDMTPDTLVPWASAVKPTTCVAVTRLWERGVLELDDPVAKYIPEFAVNGKEAVTIRTSIASLTER